MKQPSFKTEILKEKVKIKSIDFTIKKLPAYTAFPVFLTLAKKISPMIESLKSVEGDFESDQSLMFAVFSNVLKELDVDYINNDLMPVIFGKITYKDSKEAEPSVLADDMSTLEYKLGFEDVFELLLRGICVNFLDAILGKLSKLQQVMQKIKN